MAERGSDLVLQRCRTPLSDDVITRLGELIGAQGARLVGWECAGQPDPDLVLGVAHAGSFEDTVNVVREIIELEPRFTYEIFPRGIPVPEFFELRFGTPGFGR